MTYGHNPLNTPRGADAGLANTLGPGSGPARTGPASVHGAGTLTLDPLAGPPIPPIEVEPSAGKTLGRSSSCECVLPDESISRRHANISFRDGLWFVMDLGSTHGTTLNSTKLTPQQGAPLKPGDLVALGPWTFRVRTGPASHAMNSLIDDAGDGASVSRQRVERIQERELAAITQQRLNLLMECAATVVGVEDEKALAKVILDAAIQGTGFPRAALLRDVGAEIEVILDVDPLAQPGVQGTFSKSLIQEARKGEMVKMMVEDSGGAASASIMLLKIQTALCAPIKVGEAVAGFLYLDARAGEKSGRAPGRGGGGGGGIPNDAATFVLAVARMCSLAVGNLSRVQLERRQAELVRDLNAAREAQKMIMPADSATIGGVRYAMRMKPGRMVAGDLFDVVQLDAQRTAIFLGDVAGKGISAAILMATAQTYLNAALRQHLDPAMAMRMTNRHICAHAASNKFISLWLGVFDAAARTVTYVDAGHGYWLVAGGGGDGNVQRITASGGIPLGIDEDFEFTGETIALPAGSRLIVFSDGVAEQPGPDGEQFSVERAVEAVSGSRTVEDDAQRLFDAVLDYAKTDSLADDTTVASASFE
jgi:pSer/pThr/pTyr-binding forkhead associated (FHA) protein